MAASTPIVAQGSFLSGPSRAVSYVQNVATGQNPLTTTPLVLFTVPEGGVSRRSLLVNWTGDQTLDLDIQVDIGSGGNGLVTIATIHVIAGNGTAQTFLIFPSQITALSAATSLISGTQPTLAAAPAVSNTQFLAAPCDRLAIRATAGATTTVGALTLDLCSAP